MTIKPTDKAIMLIYNYN